MTGDEAMLQALILARGVPEDRVEEVAARLRARVIPGDPHEILAQLDAAIRPAPKADYVGQAMVRLDDRDVLGHVDLVPGGYAFTAEKEIPAPAVVWIGPNRPPDLRDDDDWIQTPGSEETP